MTCVRQRCHAAPGSTAAIAAFSPWCASLVMSSTPAGSRATRPRRNVVHALPSSLVKTSRPSSSRWPYAPAYAVSSYTTIADVAIAVPTMFR